MIYLDNAATTYPKPVSVLHSAEKALYDYGANPGRSGHRLSLETSRQVFYAREKCAEFFGGETENTVFTLNCTHAINFALKGVCNAKGHCHVITSDLEHNSVIRPLHALYKQKRINYSIADSGGSDDELLSAVEKQIRRDTAVVIMTAGCNVNGRVTPLARIAELCRKHNICLTNKLRENIMENKLQNLFSQCVEELKSIGIDINNNKLIGEINISLAKRNAKRYGCCRHEDPDEKYKVITKKGYKRYITYERFNKNYIEISKWVMELNDDIIKNTIMHEIIHCFPYCNNHGKEFKKYAGYINTHLGYSVSRLGNKEEDYKKSNLEYDIPQTTPNYKYKIECQKCGKYFFRQRYNKNLTRHYRCGICGGKLKAVKVSSGINLTISA